MYRVPGPAEPVDRDLRQPAAGELEHYEVDRVGIPGGVEAARVPCVDGLGQLPEEVEQEVDEMAARLEERPVGHGRAPGHRLVPRGEVHELRHLAEDEAADVRLADLVLHRPEDRLRAVLVVDGDAPPGCLSRSEHPVGLLDGGDERLLADHVGSRPRAP